MKKIVYEMLHYVYSIRAIEDCSDSNVTKMKRNFTTFGGYNFPEISQLSW